MFAVDAYILIMRSHRSAALSLLIMPIFKTEFASRAFSRLAPRTWNGQPDNLVIYDSLTSFKKQLKTNLFEQYISSRCPRRFVANSIIALYECDYYNYYKSKL